MELDQLGLPTIFLASLSLILLSCEFGIWVGLRTRKWVSEDISTLESAILGLLALLIGFTFAMALARFEDRRDAILKEANTIGTAALRARLLLPEDSSQVLRHLRSYTQMRVEIASGQATQAELDAVVAKSFELQELLWRKAMAIAETDKSPVPAGLFIQSLNEVIDSHAERLSALRNRVPHAVLLALYAMAASASAFAGFANGAGTRPSRLPIYATGILIAGVMILVVDLDRPSSGFIRVSQQPMIDAAQSIETYLFSGR